MGIQPSRLQETLQNSSSGMMWVVYFFVFRFLILPVCEVCCGSPSPRELFKESFKVTSTSDNRVCSSSETSWLLEVKSRTLSRRPVVRLQSWVLWRSGSRTGVGDLRMSSSLSRNNEDTGVWSCIWVWVRVPDPLWLRKPQCGHLYS